MPPIRLLIALILTAVVIGGFFYGSAWWRVAPLAISVVWAMVELVIESRRRRQLKPDSTSRHS